MITTNEIGRLIKAERKKLGITQQDLAMAAGTGLRFVVEVENGKENAQIGKVLHLIQALGMELHLKGSS